jgi:hypothetical protein
MNDDSFAERIQPKWSTTIIDYLTDNDSRLLLYIFFSIVLFWTLSIMPPDTNFIGIVVISVVLMLPAMIVLAPLMAIGIIFAMLTEITIRLALLTIVAIYRILATTYQSFTGKPKAVKPYIAAETTSYLTEEPYVPPRLETNETPSPNCRCETPLWIKVGVIALGIGFLMGE